MPEDFGLVAMAMVVVGIVDIVLDLGVASALIQNRSAEREHFDTAWTLRLLQSLVVAAIIVCIAPWVSRYYNDPRVVHILYVVALSLAMAGSENIGVIRFQKDMEFGRDFQFFLAKRLIATTVAIALVFLLRSYWALVLGSFAGRVAGVGLSYVLHPYRPRLSLSKWRDIWSFSQWNLVSGTANYLAVRLDQLVIGRRESASVLGAYAIGDEIAALPTTEVLAPLSRVLLPAFVEAQSQPDRLSQVVLLAFAVQVLIALPAGVGVALVATELVPVVLGSQWGPAIPFVRILALVAVAGVLAHSWYYALLSLGRVKTIAMYSMFRVVALASLLAIFPSANAIEIGELRLVGSIAALMFILGCVRAALPTIRTGDLFRGIWRPILCSVVMMGAVVGVEGILGNRPHVLVLAAKVILGGLSYCATIVVLWHVAGRPEGAESYILRKMVAWRSGPNV